MQSRAHNNVKPAVIKNIPERDHTINELKIGGPTATPKNRTEPYKEVTKPLRSVGTEPVIKLLIQGRTSPVPTLLMARTAKKGTKLSKNIREANEVVISNKPIMINVFISFIFLPILLPVI